VVVSIGLDHQDYLGTTLEAIAREKAAFPAGPAGRSRSREMPGIVEEIARELGAPLQAFGSRIRLFAGGGALALRGTRWDLPHLPAPALLGGAQYANAATAIAALEEIDARLRIPAAAVARGLDQVRLVGRFQVIPPAAPEAPTWILDVAHNPAAARVLRAQFARYIERRTHPGRVRDFGRQGRGGGGRGIARLLRHVGGA